jgi:hypothetical protein
MSRQRIAAVLCLFLASAVAPAAPARASDDGWGEPTRTCSDAVFSALNEDVDVECRQRDKSCLDMSGCFELRRTRQLLADCQRAVNVLNWTCYAGSFIFLRVESLSLQHQIEICSERIALPKPEGCGRPCKL